MGIASDFTHQRKLNISLLVDCVYALVHVMRLQWVVLCYLHIISEYKVNGYVNSQENTDWIYGLNVSFKHKHYWYATQLPPIDLVMLPVAFFLSAGNDANTLILTSSEQCHIFNEWICEYKDGQKFSIISYVSHILLTGRHSVYSQWI